MVPYLLVVSDWLCRFYGVEWVGRDCKFRTFGRRGSQGIVEDMWMKH